jgi:hypothetical protein
LNFICGVIDAFLFNQKDEFWVIDNFYVFSFELIKKLIFLCFFSSCLLCFCGSILILHVKLEQKNYFFFNVLSYFFCQFCFLTDAVITVSFFFLFFPPPNRLWLSNSSIFFILYFYMKSMFRLSYFWAYKTIFFTKNL